MKEDKEKYINHVSSGKYLTPEEKKEKEKILENRNIERSGVCPRCEKIAFADNGKFSCPNCGWSGNTLTVKEYIDKKLYK